MTNWCFGNVDMKEKRVLAHDEIEVIMAPEKSNDF